MTEGGKPKSIGVTGLSTEGKEGRLPTDKGPETVNINQRSGTQTFTVKTMCLTSVTENQESVMFQKCVAAIMKLLMKHSLHSLI